MESLYEAKARLFDAITSGGIKQVVSSAYEVSGFPVIVIDNNSYIIARAPEKGVSAPLFDALENRDRVPSEYEALIHEAYQGRTPWDKRGVLPLYYKLSGEWFVISGFVGSENNSVAFIEILLHEEPVSDADTELVYAIFNAVTRKYHEFAKFNFTSRRLQSLETMLRCASQRVFAVDAAQSLQNDLPGQYSVAVCCGDSNGTGEKERFITTQINNGISKVLAAEHEGNIVILSYNLNRLHTESDVAPELMEFFIRSNIYAGVSVRFGRMEEFTACYQQALLSAQLGRSRSSRNHITTFEECKLHICLAPAAFNYDLKALIHPLAYKLYRWDKTYHTEYVMTMREYLITGKHKKVTAERLAIHLNTLTYRLNKIEELLEAGFDDCELMTTLLINLLIMDIAIESQEG